jgi:hypothetical protein
MFKRLSSSMMLVGMLFAIGGVAAEAKMPAAGDGKSTAVVAASPLPPGEMSALYPRVGTWQVVIRTLPGASSPKGGLDKGTMTIKKGPGGFSIVQDFTSRGSSGYTVGQSYTWWDARTKAYKSVWCDSMQGCVEFTTALAGNSWTVELDGEANGEKIHTVIRATMSADHNAIHEETTSSHDGGPAHTETISDYKRVAAGGLAAGGQAQGKSPALSR